MIRNINIICLFSVLLAELMCTSCQKDPVRYVNNIYVGSWHIDTAKVNVSISLNGEDINKYPFFKTHYYSIREILQEPQQIYFSATLSDNPHSGTYTCSFSNGSILSGTYKLASNILYINLQGPNGIKYAIPCQADGNTLQIFYSNSYMTSVLKDLVKTYFPSQEEAIYQVFSGNTLTIEGLGVYNTRTRDSIELSHQ